MFGKKGVKFRVVSGTFTIMCKTITSLNLPWGVLWEQFLWARKDSKALPCTDDFYKIMSSLYTDLCTMDKCLFTEQYMMTNKHLTGSRLC